MAEVERMREPVSSIPSAEYWRERMQNGWRPVAVEWQREVSTDEEPVSEATVRPPYGLRVADDCSSLESDPYETGVLSVMLESVVSDHSLTEVAEELNRRGLSTRNGTRWTQVLVFHMLPRLIEVAPEISSTREWSERMGQLGVMAAAMTGTP